jgi:hypothetical protein
VHVTRKISVKASLVYIMISERDFHAYFRTLGVVFMG